jgi:hypothetical protein
MVSEVRFFSYKINFLMLNGAVVRGFSTIEMTICKQQHVD